MVRQMTGWIVDGVKSWWGRWCDFWFQPADGLSVAIIRILAGLMLLYSHLIWGQHLQAFFGDNGWNNRSLIHVIQPDGVPPSFWWYVPSAWMDTVHWICNIVLIAFVIGLGGRVTTILTLVIAVSYANRSMLANFGLDQILCILALYLAIAPSTQYLSLDFLIRKRFDRGKDLLRPTVSANVAMRLIQVHLCIIYLWAGLSKLQGEAWWNGNAFWLALANEEYQSNDMTWLVHFPRVMELLTHVTVAWELSFAALVWPKRTRLAVLSMGIAMHLGIGMFLGMWTFGLIMIIAYISFVPSASVLALFHRIAPRRSLAKQQHALITTTPSNREMRPSSIRKVIDVMETFVLISDARSTLARAVNMLANTHREFVAVKSLDEAIEIARFVRNPVVIQLQVEEFDPTCEWLEMHIVDLEQPMSRVVATESDQHVYSASH